MFQPSLLILKHSVMFMSVGGDIDLVTWDQDTGWVHGIRIVVTWDMLKGTHECHSLLTIFKFKCQEIL